MNLGGEKYECGLCCTDKNGTVSQNVSTGIDQHSRLDGPVLSQEVRSFFFTRMVMKGGFSNI